MVDSDESIKMVDESPKESVKMDSSKKEKTEKKPSNTGCIKSFKAKKDHRIVHNGVVLCFVKGDEYDSIDAKWEPTLSVEGVL